MTSPHSLLMLFISIRTWIFQVRVGHVVIHSFVVVSMRTVQTLGPWNNYFFMTEITFIFLFCWFCIGNNYHWKLFFVWRSIMRIMADFLMFLSMLSFHQCTKLSISLQFMSQNSKEYARNVELLLKSVWCWWKLSSVTGKKQCLPCSVYHAVRCIRSQVFSAQLMFSGSASLCM